MSNLNNRLKRLASIPNFRITGYDVNTGLNTLYVFETDDEELLERVATNTLSYTEREFIINTIGEYFEEIAGSDKRFWRMNVADIITSFFDMGINIPSGIVNEDILKRCIDEHGKIIPARIRGLNPSLKEQLILDYALYFDFVWGDDFRNKEVDIKMLIYVPQIGSESNPNIFYKDRMHKISKFKNRLRKSIQSKVYL